eukprot:GILK01009639.1.p1 GENE.GILK01009639.1~~GILK01009639.1.p1  ORF type:complete len:261 (+),score=32.75 GILK01009639.1:52-834(+)
MLDLLPSSLVPVVASFLSTADIITRLALLNKRHHNHHQHYVRELQLTGPQLVAAECDFSVFVKLHTFGLYLDRKYEVMPKRLIALFESLSTIASVRILSITCESVDDVSVQVWSALGRMTHLQELHLDGLSVKTRFESAVLDCIQTLVPSLRSLTFLKAYVFKFSLSSLASCLERGVQLQELVLDFPVRLADGPLLLDLLPKLPHLRELRWDTFFIPSLFEEDVDDQKELCRQICKVIASHNRELVTIEGGAHKGSERMA